MSIINYLKRFTMVSERKELISQLAVMREEYDLTLALSSEVTDNLNGHTLASALGKSLDKQVKRRIPGNDQSLIVTQRAMNNLPSIFEVLDSRLRKYFGNRFTSDAVTYQQVNYLALMDSVDFMIRYHRKLQLHLVGQEARAISSKSVASSWSKAEIAWINDNLSTYVSLLPLLLKSSADILKGLDGASGAIVEEDTSDMARSALGTLKTDPFLIEKGLLPKIRNPFLSWGKFRAEMQAKRYQNAKIEHDALQLRLEELRNLQEDNDISPKMQQLIKYNEARVEKLDYQIAQIEEANRYDD